jgi:hypothetical protein
MYLWYTQYDILHLKFPITTYLWSTKNHICEMKIIKIFTWFKVHGITCEINITNFIKVKQHLNSFSMYIYIFYM